MQCDMCGKEAQLYKCRIEGTYLNVCHNCCQHGEKIHRIEEQKPEIEKKVQAEPKRSEIIQIINPRFAQIIKKKREELGLKQEDLGKKIAEKESIIHNLESGNIKPDINLARKLERFLNVNLVEQYEEKGITKSSDENEGLTIGDFIKIKKRG